MEPASLRVNRRARRVNVIDVESILHTLIAWCRGERHVCSMVVMPSVEEEDLRRCHRERDRLIRERTAHINRIKGLLFGQGIRGINVKSRYKTLTPAALVTGDGRPLPERLGREITREIERLAQVQVQIVDIEHERDHPATSCEATERKRRSVTPEGPRPGLILDPRAGGVLSALRQSTAGGKLYRARAQYL